MLAKQVVHEHAISIRMACNLFSISETCYRYVAKLDDENAVVADWLLRLTHNQLTLRTGLLTGHIF